MTVSKKITKRGLILVGIAALIVSAVGLGVAQGGGGTLTKKAAKKTYLSKKSANKQFLKTATADSTFQKLEKTIQIPASMAGFTGSAFTGYSDTNGFSSGARHLDGGFGSIGWSFILPPQFSAGSGLTVKVYYALGVTGCTFNLEPNSLSVSNIGAPSVGSQGDIGTPGDLHAAPPSGQVGSLNWTIPGTVQGQQLKPGTAVTFGTFRDSAGPDTCGGALTIKGHEVSWG